MEVDGWMGYMNALLEKLGSQYSIYYQKKDEELMVTAPNKVEVKELFEQEAVKLELMEEPSP